MEENYQVIRSDRKTLSLQVRADGTLLVRAPYGLSEAKIRQAVEEKRAWIERARQRVSARQTEAGAQPKLTPPELEALAEQALAYIPERVRYYAPQVGVSYGRITIRNQHTRWGSCSSKGNLNFNCLLMLMPKEVIDSVVVHELCHRKEMNHSSRFYAEVYRVFPDYDRWHGWLQKNGPAIAARNP